MKKKELYRLPSFGRIESRLIFVRAAGLYLLALGLVAWFLTQQMAHRLGYSQALGEPWVSVPGHLSSLYLILGVLAGAAALVFLVIDRLRALVIPHVFLSFMMGAVGLGPLYTPVHLFVWLWWFKEAPEFEVLASRPLMIFVGAAGGGGVLLLVYLSVRSARFRERPDTHGSAHWADEAEVKASGLLGKQGGLLLGLWHERGKPRYLRHQGSEHVFVFAPTRTGKGVGLVLPNLLSWPHSVLVHDIKGENWALSAGWRRRQLGSLCLRFDPTDAEGTGGLA